MLIRKKKLLLNKHITKENKDFDNRPRYILENGLGSQTFMRNKNRIFLRAQKFAQGFFLGVLAHCSNGGDEANLPPSAKLRTPPPYIPIGL